MPGSRERAANETDCLQGAYIIMGATDGRCGGSEC